MEKVLLPQGLGIHWDFQMKGLDQVRSSDLGLTLHLPPHLKHLVCQKILRYNTTYRLVPDQLTGCDISDVAFSSFHVA